MKAFLGVLALFLAATVHGLELGPGPSGSSDCTTDCTFTSVTTNGTAPSLTATGAVVKGSMTVESGSGQPATLFATPADEGQLRLCNKTRGAACSFGSNGLFQLGIGNSGAFTMYGEGETFFSYAYPNVTFNNSAVKVGIGTASPSDKLQVVTASGNNVVSSSATAAGFGVFHAHGTSGGCFMIRDTDNAGWTECKALDGVLSCAIDADGVCD